MTRLNFTFFAVYSLRPMRGPVWPKSLQKGICKSIIKFGVLALPEFSHSCVKFKVCRLISKTSVKHYSSSQAGDRPPSHHGFTFLSLLTFQQSVSGLLFCLGLVCVHQHESMMTQCKHDKYERAMTNQSYQIDNCPNRALLRPCSERETLITIHFYLWEYSVGDFVVQVCKNLY